MKGGDLVRETSRMPRECIMGLIIAVDYAQHARGLKHPYQVRFFDGETCWMREGFLEVISESR